MEGEYEEAEDGVDVDFHDKLLRAQQKKLSSSLNHLDENSGMLLEDDIAHEITHGKRRD